MLKATQDPDYHACLGHNSLDLVDGHAEQQTFQAYETIYTDLAAKAGMDLKD